MQEFPVMSSCLKAIAEQKLVLLCLAMFNLLRMVKIVVRPDSSCTSVIAGCTQVKRSLQAAGGCPVWLFSEQVKRQGIVPAQSLDACCESTMRLTCMLLETVTLHTLAVCTSALSADLC